jgi:DNA-directed RNA polymerase alpha subunit
MKEIPLYADIESSDLQKLPLYHLGLEWPVFDCLQQAGLRTVGQLLGLSAREISRIPGLTLKMHFQISNRLFSPVCDELSGSQAALAELGLPEAAHDALIQGVKTLGDLSQMSYVEILAVPGLDMRDVAKITRRLTDLARRS